jgi:hypothetical protein
MQNKRTTNQTAKATMAGTRKRGTSCKCCMDKVEED